jgi:hypothetical protein
MNSETWRHSPRRVIQQVLVRGLEPLAGFGVVDSGS